MSRLIGIATAARRQPWSRVFVDRLARKRAEGNDVAAIAASGLFDVEAYLRNYPDVAKAGIDPIVHYLRQGAAEGRVPNAEFDGHYYAMAYPDVHQSGVIPFMHYVRFGRAEGRSPNGGPSAAGTSGATLPPAMANWKIRYARTLREHPDLFDPDKTILEVGSGAFGISHYLQRQVVGLEPKWTQTPNQWIDPIAGSILDSGFPDDAFDIVVCFDVLEHISRDDRPLAIREMIRIARQKVLISCPSGVDAAICEQHLAKAFGAKVPDWLTEHLQNGLPLVQDIIEPIANSGHQFTIQGNETILQHYSGVLIDFLMPSLWGYVGRLGEKARLAGPIDGSDWDAYYSFSFAVLVDGSHPARIPKANGGVQQRLQDRIAVHCVYHKMLPTSHLGNVTPIYTAEAADQAPKEALTDALSNRSAPFRNSRWSELTAIYKVWQEGPATTFVGFCHYRRLFKLDGVFSGTKPIRLSQTALQGYQIAEDIVRRAGPEAIFVPSPFETQATVFDQYCAIHNTNHICLLYTAISSYAPHLAPFIQQQARDQRLHYGNLFITGWNNFSQICDLWFSILPWIEARIVQDSGNRYQHRDISFLSERLFDIWIRYKRASGTKVIETDAYFLDFDNLGPTTWSATR